MAEYNLAVIGGDGVGPEVIAEGRKVLEALSSAGGPSFRFTEFPWGSDYYRETGRLMPEDGLEQLSGFDAILFGAVGRPQHSGPHNPARAVAADAARLRPGHLRPARLSLPGRDFPLSRASRPATSTWSSSARTRRASTPRWAVG